MLIDFKDVSSVKKVAEIEIPADAVQSEVGRVTAEFVRQAKIPGFRAGKVPSSVVRKRFGKEIDEEVVQRLLPRFFHEVVDEKKLRPVGNPSVREMGAVIEGAPLRFTAEFEVRPPVELADYRGIEVTQRSTDVTEEDVDAMVERLRQQASSFRTIDGRTVEDDDYVMVDVVSTIEGEEPRRTDGYSMHVGADAPIPELPERLRGASVGDTVVVEKQWGEDAPNEDVRGRTARYEVTVNEIRVLEKPEVTDDFVKGIGIAETVEEMRARIRDDIRRHREKEAQQAKRHEAGQKLTEMHELEVPASMVEEELQKSLRNYARFLASQGIDIEKAEIDWNRMADEFRADATRRARLALVLDAIAAKEGLTVPDAEVDAEIRKASGNPEEFSRVKHQLRHDGGYEALRGSLLEERALDLVVAEAKVVEGK